MIAGGQVESWPKRPGSSANSSSSGARKQSFSDGGGVSPTGLGTAVQGLPFGSPVTIGASALAEPPVKVETNGTAFSPVLQAAPFCQAYAVGSTMAGLNMAEALAQELSQIVNTQLSVDTQRIEELTLRKCKQLIPVMPPTSKASSCNSSEKTKSKVARGRDFTSVTKIGQLSHVNNNVRQPTRSDNTKISPSGNFQILNREKNGIYPTAKDGPGIGKVMNSIGLVPSGAVLPLKSPTDQKLTNDNKNGAWVHDSFGERKLLSQAQNRNDFFNLLRKKSWTSSVSISEPTSIETTSSLEMSEAENLQIVSPVHLGKDSFLSASGLDHLTGNRNCLNGDHCASDGSRRSHAGNGETSYLDIAVDPEEEAFLQSLGWDKNAGEEALTKEEIDAFLKKHEKQRLLKIVPANLHCSSFSVADS
ncbi:unnamed protein product [Musa textilis]